jgi:uncharacterized protein (TIGR02996 family)
MHEEFLDGLRERPDDSVLRLVYADWLQEHDDPLEEFVRLEVRLASGDYPEQERAALTTRLAELGRRAEPGWLLAVNRVPFVRCSLKNVTGRSPLDGRLELANFGTRAVIVAFDAHILQYLRFTITDPYGGVSDEWYETYPTSAGGVRHHRFTGGERLSVSVNLLNTIEADQITIGAYTIEAVYDYDGVQSRADPVRVELTDEDRRRWRLGRYASA